MSFFSHSLGVLLFFPSVFSITRETRYTPLSREWLFHIAKRETTLFFGQFPLNICGEVNEDYTATIVYIVYCLNNELWESVYIIYTHNTHSGKLCDIHRCGLKLPRSWTELLQFRLNINIRLVPLGKVRALVLKWKGITLQAPVCVSNIKFPLSLSPTCPPVYRRRVGNSLCRASIQENNAYIVYTYGKVIITPFCMN